MVKFGYALRDGWRLVTRNLLSSTLTVFTAVAVFFVIGVGLVFVMNMKNIVSTVDSQLTLQVYLNPGASAEAVLKKTSKFKGVRDAKIITKQMALDRLRSRMGASADAVALLGDNPLPDSVELMLSDASLVQEVAGKTEALQSVEEVVYAGKVAEKLTRISSFINLLSLFLLIVAVIASGIVIFNTVKLSVYSREEEIKVMLLVGATPSYVALPYIIQGVLLGFLSAATSFAFIAGAYSLLLDRLMQMLPFLSFVGVQTLAAKLGFLLLACGVTVSILASILAVENFIGRASKPR